MSSRVLSKRRFIITFSSAAVIVAPLISFAQANSVRFDTVIYKVLEILSSVGAVLVGLAVLLLAYGILKYMNAGDDPTRRGEAILLLTWGLISVFVMVSFWGLINIFLNTFFRPADLSGFQIDDRLFRR